jgi:MFS transporter, MHS family, alpha-ketoglutarate permease
MSENGAIQGARRSVASNVVRGSLGNLIEWYDWYAYAAFSVYFAATFFPKGDSTAQLLNTAGIFAVGFLMRPLGGWFFGRFADRHGRRTALTVSVSLMGVGSLMIAFIPGYASIGLLSPALLMLARMVQGISLGGEYGTSATYLSEMASAGRRGFYSSFQYVTLISGQLVALGLQIILQFQLSDQQMKDWGWRVAFGVGAVAAVTVMWLRRNMDESPSYEKAASSAATNKRGTLSALLAYPRECMTVIGLTLGGTVAFYTFTTYAQKFMVNTAGLPKAEVSRINFVALLLFACLQPVFGRLSDRFGRRPLLISFGVGATLFTVPLMKAIADVRTGIAAFGLMMTGLLIVSGYTSINAVVKAELFPAHIRALGVGLPYALTVAIFGGTTEYVALWLKHAGHEDWFFYYVAACALVSLIVYLFMAEPKRHSLLEQDFPAAPGDIAGGIADRDRAIDQLPAASGAASSGDDDAGVITQRR